MVGQIHRLIQELYKVRGITPSSLPFVRAHLVLSGIDPDDHNEHSPDDPLKVAQLEGMLADFRQAPRGQSLRKNGDA